MHIDSLFMTPRRPQQPVASWIAFEDVQPEAGPLEYYPGSHKIPLYRFRDGSYHAAVDELPQWSEYIFNEVKARELKKETFSRAGAMFLFGTLICSMAERIFKIRRKPAAHSSAIILLKAMPAFFPTGIWYQ